MSISWMQWNPVIVKSVLKLKVYWHLFNAKMRFGKAGGENLCIIGTSLFKITFDL